MSTITAAAVNELRKRTDLPMMECKSALQEAGGDMEKAIVLLRERFAKVRRVTYDDVRAVPGETYLYRVVAFTLDGYVGTPSRLARAQWSGPGAEPASE